MNFDNSSPEQDRDYKEIEVVYYLMGKRPIKVTYVDDFPEIVQTPDFETKKFIYDHTILKRIEDSVEVEKIDEQQFCNACLAIGVKPI